MSILAYQSPAEPTVVRRTAARWLKTAARASAAAAIIALVVHAILTWQQAPTPRAFFHDLFADDYALSLPALVLASTAAAFAALATPVLRANRAACYTASALVMLLQCLGLFYLFISIGGSIFFITSRQPLYLLYLPVVGLALLSVGLLSDLNHLLQWIPRYPNAETTLNRFLPRLPLD